MVEKNMKKPKNVKRAFALTEELSLWIDKQAAKENAGSGISFSAFVFAHMNSLMNTTKRNRK